MKAEEDLDSASYIIAGIHSQRVEIHLGISQAKSRAAEKASRKDNDSSIPFELDSAGKVSPRTDLFILHSIR